MISIPKFRCTTFCLVFAASVLNIGVVRSQDSQPARPLVILIGPPLSGKTTFMTEIQGRYNLPGISVEDLITEHASELQKKYPKGIPMAEMRYDPAMSRYMRARLDGTNLSRGVVLDGFPAMRTQAEDLGETAGDGDDTLKGGNGDDTLSAGNGNNTLDGGSGVDTLTSGDGTDILNGGLGDDTLSAGGGNDTLRGHWGADEMNGGDGDDRFVYLSVFESTVAAPDEIINFITGDDLIDVSGIDAVAVFDDDGFVVPDGVNEAFTFIGALAFSGTSGELRYASGIVEADIDGDTVADFAINVLGVSGATDFVL